MPTSKQIRDKCHICKQGTSRRCALCNLGWFCSQACQDQMSLPHLAKCSARSITTADILYDDAVKDQIPEDQQTREHFGFSRCRHPREESHLFGLYQGLLIYLGISPIQLNEWQQKGNLVSKIIDAFSALPEQSRGGYFPWFLRNQRVLDHSTPPLQLDGKDNPLQQALDAARSYLDPEDRDKDLCQFEPLAKRYCFIFYALALDSARPNPNWAELDMWYDFGFAVSTDESCESGIGVLYGKLVGGSKIDRDYDRSLGYGFRSVPDSPTCSFDEFWRAWQNGSLAKVFDKYGLGDALDGNPAPWRHRIGARHLRGFISVPMERHGLRPSVWRLKHLLALRDNTPVSSFPKIEAAAQEYGFARHLDARTRIALRQFYRRLLDEGDPLDVHEAKNRSGLLEYAESCLGDIDDRVRDVLRKLGPTR